MPRCLIAIAFVVLSTATALAQNWPEKPVKIVVPYPPGGATDILARVLADRLSGVLGQAFVVENRGGAGGMIGANAVAKAAPDGHTLLVCSTAEIAINQSVYGKMSYDPLTDLAPITLIAWTPLIVVAHPSVNASNPDEFIALLKGTTCLIGNSSAGIKECSYLGTPVVNIGVRQQGRLHADNVVHAADESAAILDAVRQQMAHGRYPSSAIYHKPAASRTIVDLLATLDLYTQKRFFDNAAATVRT